METLVMSCRAAPRLIGPLPSRGAPVQVKYQFYTSPEDTVVGPDGVRKTAADVVGGGGAVQASH